MLNFSHNKRNTTIYLVFLLDIIVTAASFVVSYIVCSQIYPDINADRLLLQLPVIIAFSCLIFITIGLYRGFVNHDRIREVYHIFNAICLVNILTIIFVVVHGKLSDTGELVVPLSIIIVHSIISFMGLAILRRAYKLLFRHFQEKPVKSSRAVVLGQTKSLEKFKSIIDKNSNMDSYDIVAWVSSLDLSFIPEDALDEERVIMDLEMLDKMHVDHVFILSNTRPSQKRKIFKQLFSTEIDYNQINFSPTIALHEDYFELEFLPLNLEDLYIGLNQDIRISPKRESRYFEGKKVLITGAAGSIGSELSEYLLSKVSCKQVVLLDFCESSLFELEQKFLLSKYTNFHSAVVDIRNGQKLQEILEQFSPDFIFHCAGFKCSVGIAGEEIEALRTNLIGTKNLVEYSKSSGVTSLVQVTCDFQGSEPGLIHISQIMSEFYLKSLSDENLRLSSVRLTNTLEDTKGSLVNRFKSEIETGIVTLPDAFTTARFMGAQQVIPFLINGIMNATGGEIYSYYGVVDINLLEMSKLLIQFENLSFPEDVKIHFDKEVLSTDRIPKRATSAIDNFEDNLSKDVDKVLHFIRESIDEICLDENFSTDAILELYFRVSYLADKNEWGTLVQ